MGGWRLATMIDARRLFPVVCAWAATSLHRVCLRNKMLLLWRLGLKTVVSVNCQRKRFGIETAGVPWLSEGGLVVNRCTLFLVMSSFSVVPPTVSTFGKMLAHGCFCSFKREAWTLSVICGLQHGRERLTFGLCSQASGFGDKCLDFRVRLGKKSRSHVLQICVR